MASIIETTQSGEMQGGSRSSIQAHYKIFDSTDRATVAALVLATAPATIDGLVLNSYTVSPLEGAAWEARVEYGPVARRDRSQRETGEAALSFDTRVQTQHITLSRSTITAYGANDANGVAATTDWGGLIGVSGANQTLQANGADVQLATFGFQITKYWPATNVGGSYISTLHDLTGTVNNGTVSLTFNISPTTTDNFTFQAGELLFLGAQGSLRGEEDWELTYAFAASSNTTSLTIGGIGPITKKGWEYVWARYRSDLGGTTAVLTPRAVYVEQVYRTADFSLLGL
jgi:hypothetical protein